MNPRFTILMGFLLLLAAGWIFFVQPQWGSTQERARHGGILPPFTGEQIDRIEIEREDARLIFLRQPRGWRMESPVQDTAASAKVEEILQLASTLRAEERIPAGEFRGTLRSGAYGFNPPKLKLRLSGPRRDFTLEFGREAASPERIFLRRSGSEETFVVAETLAKELQRPVADFRDPRLVNLPADLIERLRWQWDGATIELAHRGPTWSFSRPLVAPAETALVERLLENFLGAKVQEFVPPGERWGRAQERGQIQLWAEGTDEPLTISIAEEPDGFLLARENRPGFFRIDRENLRLVTLPWEDLRQRRLEVCFPDLVDRFTVTVAQEAERKFRRDGKNWLLEHREQSREVSGELVADFLQKLNATPILDFVGGKRAWNAQEPPPQFVLAFHSFLSENTPEALAGQFPLATLRLGPAVTQPFASAEEVVSPVAIPARLEGSLESLLLDPAVENTVRDFLSAVGENRSGE